MNKDPAFSFNADAAQRLQRARSVADLLLRRGQRGPHDDAGAAGHRTGVEPILRDRHRTETCCRRRRSAWPCAAWRCCARKARPRSSPITRRRAAVAGVRWRETNPTATLSMAGAALALAMRRGAVAQAAAATADAVTARAWLAAAVVLAVQLRRRRHATATAGSTRRFVAVPRRGDARRGEPRHERLHHAGW